MTEAGDAATVYPAPSTQIASINNLNQITDLSGQALTYDAVGNLLSDGARTYAWNAENRLISIAYPDPAGNTTGFVYDGLGRRVAIVETPAGGCPAATTRHDKRGDNFLVQSGSLPSGFGRGIMSRRPRLNRHS